MERPEYHKLWPTTKEIAFLSRLGTCSEAMYNGKPIGVDRQTLLKRYRDSMYLRTDWCGMSESAIRQYLYEVII